MLPSSLMSHNLSVPSIDADTSSTDGWGAKLRLLMVATWSHSSSFSTPAQPVTGISGISVGTLLGGNLINGRNAPFHGFFLKIWRNFMENSQWMWAKLADISWASFYAKVTIICQHADMHAVSCRCEQSVLVLGLTAAASDSHWLATLSPDARKHVLESRLIVDTLNSSRVCNKMGMEGAGNRNATKYTKINQNHKFQDFTKMRIFQSISLNMSRQWNCELGCSLYIT